MKKMPTLFKKNLDNLKYVTEEVDPVNNWVLDGNFIATIKWDGTACMIYNNRIFRRYDAKIDIETGKLKKPIPENAFPCSLPDKLTGHFPHWLLCDESDTNDQFHFEAFKNGEQYKNGTYELCGPKFNKNKYKFDKHILIQHLGHKINITDVSFYGLKELLKFNYIEGIVFYKDNWSHTTYVHKLNTYTVFESEAMCKIRRHDFGIEW